MNFLEKYPYLSIIYEMANKRKVSVYLVGGFLRDYCLGARNSDFDFCLENKSLDFAKEFADRIKGAYIVLDADRKCARVVKKKNRAASTYDFADLRAKTLKGDLRKRDFTINTFYYDLRWWKEGDDLLKLLRQQRTAFNDLKDKKIRMTGSRAFVEDPLRMLRAFSLKAGLGFSIEAGTMKQIKKDMDLIRDVSAERVNVELFKIFSAAQTGKILRQMDRCRLLEKIIPQIQVMFNCEQGGYHHLDVWKHSLEAVEQADRLFKELKDDAVINKYLDEKIGGDHSRRSLIKLAALLHDIGKPQTRKRNETRYTFYGHERVGKNIVRAAARMLKISTRERHVIEDLVLFHLRPGFLSNFKKPSEKAIFRFFRDTKEEAVSVLLLSLADQRATRGPLTTDDDQTHHELICKKLISRFFEKKKSVPLQRLVTGHDLINVLKLNPSPLFAKILNEIEELQNLGKILSREQALEYIKEHKNSWKNSKAH